jgi:hypothetical protein
MQNQQWTAGNLLDFPGVQQKGPRKFNPAGYPNG